MLEEVERDNREVVANQDGAPFAGTGGRREPEERLTDAPSRLDALEMELYSAGLIKGTGAAVEQAG